MEQLTVAQLIEALRAMPPDLPVQVEGCDCWQKALFVSDEGDEVCIRSREPTPPRARAKDFLARWERGEEMEKVN